MIHIELREPRSKNLLDEAEHKTREIIENVRNGREPNLDNFYKKFRRHLENLFHHKCAYCETIVDEGSWMDVEHFRPKGSFFADECNRQHLGYYWLVYDWKNLLLSCNKCNRPPGKGSKFPILGVRAFSPEDSIDEEKPLLLNPYEDKPEEHLEFHEFGIISGKTERGWFTIEVCNLKREELRSRRAEEAEKIIPRLLLRLLKPSTPIVTDDMKFSAYLKKALVLYTEYELEHRLPEIHGSKQNTHPIFDLSLI